MENSRQRYQELIQLIKGKWIVQDNGLGLPQEIEFIFSDNERQISYEGKKGYVAIDFQKDKNMYWFFIKGIQYLIKNLTDENLVLISASGVSLPKQVYKRKVE